jgi:hypothetical protein
VISPAKAGTMRLKNRMKRMDFFMAWLARVVGRQEGDEPFVLLDDLPRRLQNSLAEFGLLLDLGQDSMMRASVRLVRGICARIRSNSTEWTRTSPTIVS